MSTVPQSPAADRGLLLGVLALQLDFLGGADLQNALKDWARDPSRPFADLLIDSGLLAARRRDLLEGLVREYLLQHDDDVTRALIAACAARALPVDLGSLIGPTAGNYATLPSSPGTLAPTGDVGVVGPPTPSAQRFRVLRPHARGALGVVYLAVDEELHREVALKEIQSPYHLSFDSRTRFLLEAEITGTLEHPGIVPVYALSHHPDGRPFYAMRFIRGESLQEAVTRFHQQDDGRRDAGERALALRGLLRRFVDVCNAIAYAHSRGVIHRDLKPANVMLGPFGETLVVDWGLAKVLDRPCKPDSTEIPVHPVKASAQTTMLGQVVGTPAYMSPEQAAGRLHEVGPASDVYSLGATLYHLLAGAPPFPGYDPTAVIAQVLSRNFLPPRKVKGTAPPALEAVILKAMAERPAERYAGAAELAHDVERYLADEPVGAYAEPAWERAQRWGRRNRTLVSGFFVLLLTALLAAGVGLYFVGKERDRAVAAERRAKKNFGLARDAVDECFLVATEDQRFQTDRTQGIRKVLLEKALPFYEGFESQKPDDRGIREELSRNHFRVAFITSEIGRKEKALGSYEKARRLFAELAERYPDEEKYRSDLARTCNNLAILQSEAGMREAALRSYEQALRLREELAGDGDAERRADLAGTLNNVGYFYYQGGQADAARRAYRRAEEIQTELARAHRGSDAFAHRVRLDLAATYNNLGVFLVDQKDPQGAGAAFEKSRKLRERLADGEKDSGRRRADLADTLLNQGDLLVKTGRPRDARTNYQQARDTFAALAADFTDVVEYRSGLANALTHLAELRGARNDHEEAIKLYQEAEAIHNRLSEGDPEVVRYRKDLASTRSKLGDLQRDAGRYDEAMKSYGRALDLRTGDRQLERAAHDGLARTLDLLKRPREAAEAWGEVIRRTDGDRFDPRVRRAASLARAGDHAAALAELEELEKAADGERSYLLACVASLSSASARRAGEASAAERHAARAVGLLRRAWKAKLFADAEWAEHLHKDEDLEPLKGRDDFARFLELVAKTPGGG